MADEILAGRLTVDTSEFTRKITEAVNKANAQIAKVGKEDGSNNVGNSVIAKTTQAYRELTRAMTEYGKTKQTMDRVGQQYWRDQVMDLNKYINLQKSYLDDLQLEVNQRKQLEQLIQRTSTAMQQFNQRSKNMDEGKLIQETARHYRDLIKAIGEYQKAVKVGNSDNSQYWREEIENQKRALEGEQAYAEYAGLSGEQRKKINEYLREGETAYQRFLNSGRQELSITDGLAQQWNKIANVMRIVSGFSIYKVFSEALKYAKDFNAALTDISVITTGTRIDAEALGASYRKMANDLRVSSTEIAKANATIFRQGFQDPNQAAAITRGATKFGAVTGIGTSSAIQNMTAAIQNFYKKGEDIGQFVEHLGDVWSYMGDTVATTGEEISEAMSKTAASVNSVGVSMEQASAWAAIMLANTQQAGNVIGTQMNSLIARYAKVTSKGYEKVTSDDEGEALSFNDVSKALREVGIEMYDVASKSFLPMNEMMDQLADKWGSLDEAQKKYIATTLGGTRGMNYLLTLLDNYNDAVELQAGIIDGIVNSKYEAWMQGVEAAQNNLTNSMENLYAYLSSDVLTGFYNGLANLVDIFVDATDAVGGFNLKIPLAVAGIMGLISAIMAMKNAIQDKGIIGFFNANSITLVVTALMAVITIIGKIRSALQKSNIDINEVRESLSKVNSDIQKWSAIGDELDELSADTQLTADEMDRFVELRKQIVADSPYLQAVYGDEGQTIKTLADAYRIYTAEIEKATREKAALMSLEYQAIADEKYKRSNVLSKGDGISHLAALEYGGKTIWGADVEASQGLNYIGYVRRATEEYGSDLGIQDLETMMNGLRQLKDEIDILGTEYEDEWNRAYHDAESLIIKAQSELESLWGEMAPQILANIFNPEDVKTLSGDSFMTAFITSLGLSHPDWDRSTFEELMFPRIEEVGEMYAIALTEGLTQEVRDKLSSQMIDLASHGYNIDSMADLFALFTEAQLNATGNYNVPRELKDNLSAMINSGLTPTILEAINESFESVKNSGLEGDALDEAYVALYENILAYISDPQKAKDFANDYAVSLPITVKPEVNEDEDNGKKLSDSILEQINNILSKYGSGNFNGFVLEFPADISTEDYTKLSELFDQYHALLQYEEEAFSHLPEGVNIDDAQESYEHLRELYELRTKMEESAKNGGNILDYSKELTEEGIYGATSLEEGILAVGEAINSIQSPLQDFFDWLGVSFEDTNTEIYETIARFGELGATISGVKADQDEYRKSVEDLIHPMNDVEKAVQTLRSGHRLEIDEVGDLIKKYPDLADELSEYGRDTKNTTKLVQELNKHIANDAMNEWADSVESAVKKLDGLESGTREYSNAMVELSNSFDFQGLGTLSNLDFVTQNLDNIRAAAYGSADAFRALQEAAWINIIGSSDVDFSAVQNGIYAVDEAAIQAFNLLQSLGMGTVEYVDMKGYGQTLTPLSDGSFTINTVELNNRVAYWKPTASNPLSGSGFKKSSGSGGSGGGGGGKKGGGGGGGGGSSSIKVSDSTQTLLDEMTKVQDEMDNKLKLIDLKREFHDIRGEIQGVIAYTKLEGDTLKEQNVVLESNIAKLKEQIDEKQSVIDKNKSSSTAYKQAAKDLEELNKAHKEYTEQLLENINRLEKITLEMEKLQEEARQTTISVQELIRDTLEGKRKYERDMLDGTVALEDEIVEIIKKRYEKEQEMTIEAAEARQEALRAEIDEIDELISAREKLLNKEKESEEIAELQAKIARISADPTRRKEMMELQSQLAEKQKQQAWDTYEEELQAQKDSLNKQIDNIDDYMDYVNEYYEDLFEHPKKLIAEMREIIKQSDSEIIEWLKANTEEWSDYTEAKMQQTEEDWQEMINTMRGVTETYQKEIEEIMSWTNEEIITWLKQNNVDFQTATKEQQDSFLYTWKQTLTDWRNAYKSVVAEVNATQYSTPSYSVGGGGGGGGSYGGGGGGGYYGGGSSVSTPTSSTSTYATPSANTSLFTAAAAPPKTYTGHATYYYIGGSGKKLTVERTATSTAGYADAIKKAKDDALAYAKQQALSSWQTYRKANAGEAKDWIKYNQAYLGITKNPPDTKYVWFGNAYKKGGIIDYTGPAWVDGSKGVPERILTGEQNALFETLVATLQEIKRVSVPGFNGGTDNAVGFAGRGLVIEQINIQTQNLDSDADFDYIAERVGESIMSGLQRTMPTGGIKTF